MNLVLVIIVGLLIASCESRPPTQSQTANGQLVVKPAPTQRPETIGTSEATGTEQKKDDAPFEFRRFDFKNLTYPVTYKLESAKNVRRRSVELKDGIAEYPSEYGGADYGLRDINYADLNGDGRKEAIVWLGQVICGVSCDGGSDLIYFYSNRNGRPHLLSRIEAGSTGYGCALKSFILKGRRLTLETFRPCRFDGTNIVGTHGDPDEQVGKFVTNRYTRFELQFNGSRFVLRKRKIFKIEETDGLLNHDPKIEISK
jgi:hypothetical protein